MTLLAVGDPVPAFECRSPLFPRFAFLAAAGRPTVLTYVGTAASEVVQKTLASFETFGSTFDGRRAVHFAVSCDGDDEATGRLREHAPGFRVLWDFERTVAKKLGVLEERAGDRPRLHAVSYVLDANLRVRAVLPIDDPESHARNVVALIERLLPAGTPQAAPSSVAPVLLVPNVMEPELCATLIDYFERSPHEPTGVVLHHADGPATLVVDPSLKRRRDVPLRDEALRESVRDRVRRRIVPELAKAFQFHATRIERYVVARYDADSSGFFSEHRDNQGLLTAHRQFACSLNLNADDYDGGDLVFPEYGALEYRPPTGGALVFSCSLLHAVVPVTRGHRYCVLPFLSDAAGEAVRQANMKRKRQR